MANYFAFIDESGVLDQSRNEQPFFAVGFLRVLDTSILSEQLTQRHYDYFSVQKDKRKALMRGLQANPRALNAQDLNILLASTRHHEYKFTNVTHTTLQRYKEFLDTALAFPLHFCALVIDKTDPLFDSTLYKNYWSAYIKYAKLLCEKNCDEGNFVIPIADYMNRPKEASLYFEKELNALPNVRNTLRAHSETFTLLQLCDILLGSTLFQWRQAKGFVKESNRARAKEDFVEHLVAMLDIPSGKQNEYPLAQSITCRKPIYFSVWPLKLSNKKDGGV